MATRCPLFSGRHVDLPHLLEAVSHSNSTAGAFDVQSTYMLVLARPSRARQLSRGRFISQAAIP
eukprot:6695381-Karenia_brevis.AAC.1